MTIKKIITAANLQTVLSAKNTYFIVEENVTLQDIKYTLGNGSVIEFSGGCFQGITGTSLNLNGGQVIADPYPIFTNMEVTGFSNGSVYAEWFKDNDKTADYIYINKALKSANGCPVLLSKKVYELTGTIVFPSASPSTLIATGTLEFDEKSPEYLWKGNPIAIDINVNNVTLDINTIRFPGEKVAKKMVYDEKKADLKEDNNLTTVPLKGTAIRISGQVFHVSVKVNTILYPERGIEISPGRDNTYANIQYLDIEFQQIYAKYGLYINIFTNANYEKNWLTRSSVRGGRLRGDYGIYMHDIPVVLNSDHISEMCFSNIGLEELKAIPLYLSYASRLRFNNIRMAEGLPKDNFWIKLKNVTWTNFDIHGDFNVAKIDALGQCRHVKIRGQFLRDTNWGQTPFDTHVIDTAPNDDPAVTPPQPQKALTCSVNPYQITNLVEQSGNLQQIQPTMISPIAGKYDGLKVLPRILRFKISENAIINLTGLKDYAPCIYYFSIAGGAILTLKSNDTAFVSMPTTDNRVVRVDNYTLNLHACTYQMMWLANNGKMQISLMPL